MHAVDLLDAKTVHQPVLDHRNGARAAFFRRLKDHDRLAREIARLREIARGTQKHRGMTVMAAGVHQAFRFGGVRQVGRFLDRQGIHVGAQPDHFHTDRAGGPAALDDADHTGAANAGDHLVAAELPEAIRHKRRRTVHLVQEFGMFMNIPPPGLDVGLQIGDAVDDGHGRFSAFGLIDCPL